MWNPKMQTSNTTSGGLGGGWDYSINIDIGQMGMDQI